jgi:integrase
MRRKIMTNTKTMLNFAQGRGLVAHNVALGIRIKSDSREASRGPLRPGVDFPSMAELKLLIENASPRRRPFIVTAIFTGMRLSELRGLPWSDVDLDAGVIHVRQRADLRQKIGPPKSKAGKRDLRQWREECPRGPLNLVFPNGAGNVEQMSNVYELVWYPLQKKCGLTVDADGNPILTHRYGFHILRRAAASLFIQYSAGRPSACRRSWGIHQSR